MDRILYSILLHYIDLQFNLLTQIMLRNPIHFPYLELLVMEIVFLMPAPLPCVEMKACIPLYQPLQPLSYSSTPISILTILACSQNGSHQDACSNQKTAYLQAVFLIRVLSFLMVKSTKEGKVLKMKQF